MDNITVIVLLLSGVLVGFINTLAAGATIVSVTIFMALGMPIIEASGTSRIAVVIQNLVASLSFCRQNILNIKKASILSIPVVLGTLVGAQFSMMVSDKVFSIVFSGGLVLMTAMLLLKPSKWLRIYDEGLVAKPRIIHFTLLFLAGIYGGSVYVGLGYFLIAIFVLQLGYDLIRANAIKGYMAFITTPFSLVVFMMHGQVNYTYGIVHAIGNILGAYVAAKYAVRLGSGFVRWLLIALILVSILTTLDIIDLSGIFKKII